MLPACTAGDLWICAKRGLILFLFLFVELSDARPQEVRVGGVLDLGSYQGKQSNVAIQLAIQDVNNNPNILNGTLLQFENTEIGSSLLINAANVLKLFRASVVSVVAPMTAHVSNFVSFVADSAQVPLITFSGNDPSMSMKQSAYSIQMIGRDAVQMKAIASLLTRYYWREIVVIFQDDELGLSGILALNNALQGTSATIVQKFPVSHESFNNSFWKEIQKRLDYDKTRSRVFVVHTSYRLAQKIFLEAKQSGITKNQGWAWIVTEWGVSSLDGSDDTSMDSMQGVIGIRTSITHTPHFQNISSRWKDKFIRSYPNVTHYENIGIVGAYAYDSIWIIANAIDALFRDNKITELEFNSSGKFSTDTHVFQGGKVLFQKAAESNFIGISGNITFSKNGLLEVDSYEIINVVNKEIRVVGSWAKEEFKLIEGIEIMWPNGSSVPPSGYRKIIVGVPPRVVFAEFISTENNKNPDYNDLVEQVANKTFDAVVADITILANRSAKVDYTQPYTDTGLVIMVPIKNTKSSGWAFLHPFTISMWLTSATFVILTAFLVWLFERDENDAFTGKPVKQMETSLWFSFSTIVFVHREKIMTSLGKLILMIWLFVALILNSSYTASLAAFLTAQQLSPTIRDIETLRESTAFIGHMDGSFARDYLIQELKIEENRLVRLFQPQDYVNSLKNGTIGAIVDETPYIHMIMSKHCGEFASVGRAFYRGGFGFLFSKGFPILPEMTTTVLNIIQNKTELEMIRSNWFGPPSSSSSCSDEISIFDAERQNDSERLSPWSFWGLFVIASAAYCLLLIAYFGRNFYKRRLISTRVENVPSTPLETPLTAIQLGPVNSDLSSSSPRPLTNANTTYHGNLNLRPVQRRRTSSA